MPAFLEQLADELYDEHQGELSGLCLVFPTRRAGLFFKKNFAEKIQHPHWSPVIYSIQDFIGNLSSRVIPDQLALLFELFEVYKKYFPAESFEKYFPWGEMLLKDFDEADRSLADTKQLFAYIRDEKQIDTDFELPEEDLERIRLFWRTFFNKEPGKLKNEFLANWKHLGDIYTDFQQRLAGKNWAYEGLSSRIVAENLGAQTGSAMREKVIFAGFYALSKSEEKIVQYFLSERKAAIYWDVDAYYLDDPKQEAGTFLRKNKLLKPGFKWNQNNFQTLEKNIEITGVPFQVGQARLTGNILKDLSDAENFLPDKTAIVLPDENLLFPVLYSLPENIEAFNVTMGYPLSATPVYMLLESLVLLQKNIRKKKDGSIHFYQKDVMNILHHPSIQQAEGGYIRSWMKQFQADLRWIRIPAEKLNGDASPSLFRVIFQELKKPEDVFGYFKLTLQHLLNSIMEREFRFHEIESEYIYHFYVQVTRLEDVCRQYNQQISLETFWNLYRDIISSSKIPFSGEPLKGLQIMGFLETRVLDFDNVFILSVNEDLLPASSNHPSFIPYNIRKAFGLPTYEDQHAVASYHFYRLLQRAKNIYLLYNTETKSISAGEKSRYLLQLEHELTKKYPGKIRMKHQVATTDLVKVTPKSVQIQRTNELAQVLSKYFLKENQYNEYSPRLSASALISYISCPLKFYFQYVAKIREQDEAEEYIEAATFGKILHRSMQLLYGEYTVLTVQVLDQLAGKIQEAVDLAIREEFKSHDLLEGKNILVRHVIIELAGKIIKADRQDAPITIRFLEQKFFQPFQVTAEHAVLLHGIIDRIDEVGGVTRIIDYKTGKIETGVPGSMSELFSDPKFKEQFQTYYYAYLFWKQSVLTPVKSGIIALKNLSEGIRFINKGEVITTEQFREFEDHLQALIKEIVDPHKPIAQTADLKRCEYCAYKEICNR